jgi:hypothetical protein
MKLVTKNVVRQLQWRKMQTNEGIVQCRNAFPQNAEEQAAVLEPVREAIEALEEPQGAHLEIQQLVAQGNLEAHQNC